MNEMKLCKDCRWYEANKHTTASNNLDYCHCPRAATGRVDLVRGDHRPAFAESERIMIKDTGCGPSAKLWEPLPSDFTPADEQEAQDVSF